LSLFDQRVRCAGWLALATMTVGVAACNTGEPAASAGPSPSSSPVTFGPPALSAIPAPPTEPLQVTDASPAAQAVLSAARKTIDSGSFRFRLEAHFAGATSGQEASIVASGESESATRSHVTTDVTLPQHAASSESITYDGVTYTRSGQEAWSRTSTDKQPAGPRSYLGYLSKSSGFADAGPGDRNGLATEKYTANLEVTPASPAAGTGTSTASSTAAIVLYVDKASGRLVAEDIDPRAGTLGSGLIQIDFTDFGAVIQLAPPPAAP